MSECKYGRCTASGDSLRGCACLLEERQDSPMSEGKMSAGELAKLARLNAARTDGEWARPYVLCIDDEYAIGVERGDEENSSFLLICDINEEPDNYAANADFIVAAANAMSRLLNHISTLQREADGMREALVKVAHAMDTLIHEGVDRGKGHWPAWDDCARAVDAARAALNGSPQERA